MSLKILVTGANGFVGSALMPRLEELGHQVKGIDRNDTPLYKIHKNTIIGDIFDISKIESLNTTFDIIIHCAAAKNDFGISDKEYFRDNEQATKVLIEYAEKQNINKVIYFSTVSAYGHQDKICDESDELLSNTIYGDSKLAGEYVINDWLEKDENNRAVILRPSVIYGVNNYANMYNLIDKMYGNPLLMIGNGSHVKSMVAVSNMVDMTIFTMDLGFDKKVEIFNCIDKPYISLNELMKIVASQEGFAMPKLNIPVWFAYVLATPFEILSKLTGKDLKLNWNRIKKFATSTDYRAEKIREKGYVQKFSTEEEIVKMATWYRSLKK